MRCRPIVVDEHIAAIMQVAVLSLHVAINPLLSPSECPIIHILRHEHDVSHHKIHGSVGGCRLLVTREQAAHNVASVPLEDEVRL